MAPQSGPKSVALRRRGVEDRLFAEPYCFEFVQAVRLLRLFYPERRATGFFHAPDTEIARFGARPSLSFPPSELYSLGVDEEGEKPLDAGPPPIMRVNFMGLFGPSGQLPLYYTELIAERAYVRDRALRDFLDIFNHRAISLFFRAWEKYRFGVVHERGEEDRFSRYLLSMVGLGAPSLQHRQIINDYDYLYYGGLLAQQPHSAESLELMLEDYFSVPVKVEQFLGAWYKLDVEAQCDLDVGAADSRQLGYGAVVGDEIWDTQSRIRVVIGPLSLAQYRDFLPTGTAFLPLKAMVRYYTGDELDFELQLILRKEETPACELGAAEGTPPQLGWISWAKTMPMAADPTQTVLQL